MPYSDLMTPLCTSGWLSSSSAKGMELGRMGVVVVVVVVLLPKAEGGFRPIGLIPNAPRIWMRVRRIEAKAWK